MIGKAPLIGLTALSLALAGCGDGEQANQTNAAQPAAEASPGGDQTIAASLEQNSRFFGAVRASGLDATLAGPGPYTVLVPSDQAFAQLPEGALNDLMQPEARGQLTDILTYHILPGVVLVEDIRRAIDNADGRAILATMGGETLTATREGDNIVLADAGGGRAVITQADMQRSNGVMHHINGVLMPAPEGQSQQGSSPQQPAQAQ